MTYEIQALDDEELDRVLKMLPERSFARTLLTLALRDGPKPIGRVIDHAATNWLMELPKEVRSPGYGFYCFWLNGKHYEFLRLESYLPDIKMESALPTDCSVQEFLNELTKAVEVHRGYLALNDGQVVAMGKAFVPVIKG